MLWWKKHYKYLLKDTIGLKLFYCGCNAYRARGGLSSVFGAKSAEFPLSSGRKTAQKGDKMMLKWNKMEEIRPEEEEVAINLEILTSSEVPVRKRAALEAYIEQLETRIAVSDASRNPRYVQRLKNEVKMANKELRSVTES